MAIGHILDISKCKRGDTIGVIYANPGTPSDPVLDVYDLDGNLIEGMIDFDNYSADYFYFFYDTTGLTAQKHYKLIIDDVTPYPNEEYLFYITDELTFENSVYIARGLSGWNRRLFDFTYTNGNLVSYKVRIYETAAKLNTAQQGGTDDYLYSFVCTITYDTEYNKYTIQSVRE